MSVSGMAVSNRRGLVRDLSKVVLDRCRAVKKKSRSGDIHVTTHKNITTPPAVPDGGPEEGDPSTWDEGVGHHASATTIIRFFSDFQTLLISLHAVHCRHIIHMWTMMDVMAATSSRRQTGR